MIALYLGKQIRRQIVDCGYSYGHHRGWGGRTIDVYEYEEGKLVLDFVDTKAKKLIWQGSTTVVIDPDLTPQQRDKRITEAVAKILENFPPAQSK